MVPRVVQDAGYTTVGLGVLALQQVQIRRREIARTVSAELAAARRQVQALLTGVRAKAAPVTSQLDGLPRLPDPIGQFVELGRARLAEALRPSERS